MFGIKTVDSIVQQFNTMVLDLDKVIDSEDSSIKKTTEAITELEVDRMSAESNKNRAQKIQKNILALVE